MNFNRLFIVLGIIFASVSAHAQIGQNRDREGFKRPSKTKFEPEIVKWVGELIDEGSRYDSEVNHEFAFVKKDNGKRYDVINSPDLVTIVHNAGKNFLVEIEAERTAKILFWGGNLIVKNLKILKETSDAPVHKQVTRAHWTKNLREET